MTARRKVVIVGAGLGGARAAEALRAAGHDGQITVIGRERHAPYDRPPLSKQVLTGSWQANQVELGMTAPDVEWRLGTSATGLDLDRRRLTLSSGEALPYEALVLAPGAEARRTQMCALSGVHVVRTLDDTRRC